MASVDWRPFDYKNKTFTAPPHDVPVWIRENQYVEGVTIGFFDGFTFCTWTGSNDCHVSWWADLDYPDDPGPGEDWE